MVIGRETTSSDKEPLPVHGGTIESVNQFPYLGSVVDASGRVDADVDRRISQASSAFGALRKSVFLDRDLNLATMRIVYQACVLSVLFYGSECWTLHKRHSRRLDAFHHRCIKTVLGITNHQQWTNHITSDQLCQKWGDKETTTEKIQNEDYNGWATSHACQTAECQRRSSLDGSANHDQDVSQRRDGEMQYGMI